MLFELTRAKHSASARGQLQIKPNWNQTQTQFNSIQFNLHGWFGDLRQISLWGTFATVSLALAAWFANCASNRVLLPLLKLSGPDLALNLLPADSVWWFKTNTKPYFCSQLSFNLILVLQLPTTSIHGVGRQASWFGGSFGLFKLDPIY